MKICSVCSLEQEISEFYFRRGKPRAACKKCTITKNKETITKVAKLRSQRNYRDKNRQELNQKHSDYKKLNRDLCNAQWMKYHAKKLNATPPWLSEDHFKQIKAVYAHAKECELLTGDKYHVDHIVPLQGANVCGLHVPWNLQVLPADINIAKSNRYGQ